MMMLAHAWLIAGCLVAAYTDLRGRRIPNLIPAVLALVWLVFGLGQPGEWWAKGLGGALALAAPLFIGATLSMCGMGDVKLAGAAGLYLGFGPSLLAGAVAALGAAVIGFLARLWVRGGAKRPGVPYAPFLTVGVVVALALTRTLQVGG